MENSNPQISPPRPAGKRILVFIGLNYIDGPSLWYREAGLIVRSLRSLGADAWLIGLCQTRQAADPAKPVITATRDELEDPAWWRAQAPYGVLFMLWGARRFDAIRQAALQATPRIIEKLDTDGVRSPRVWFWEYLLSCWMFMRDRGTNAILAPPLALGRTVVLQLFPGVLDRKLTGVLSRIPVVAAESPIAVERIRRWVRTLGFKPMRMACIPHPVDETDLGFDPVVRKENKIISAGRWDSKQKNLPLMLKVLEDFLILHPDWSADLAGRTPKDLERRLNRMPESVRKRLRLPGLVPHDQLARYYRSARIYLMTSRHEAFCNAASEALCCGCSVVGPVDTAGLPYVAGYASGTVACRKSSPHLQDALCAEVAAWEAGWRDPQQIATTWSQRLTGRVVAGNILETFDQI